MHSYHGVEKLNKQRKKEHVGSLFLLNNCSEQAAAGMLREFPVYFVPLQSNSTQPNMHDSCADTEDCIKCGFSHETDCWRNYCEDSFWMNLDILYRCRSLATNRMLHINCAQKPHVNQDSHTECCTLTIHQSHMLIKICSYLTVSQRKCFKFHLKITTHESQHSLQ